MLSRRINTTSSERILKFLLVKMRATITGNLYSENEKPCVRLVDILGESIFFGEAYPLGESRLVIS